MADVAGNSNRQYVTVLAITAVFIVLIGCINFMNLSTARSARRAKEVGLRKVAGAARMQLVRQFLSESLLISVASLVIAILIALVALPYINTIVGKQLVIDFTDPVIMGAVAGITVITGLLSGIYPALVLSGFSPIKVLKKDVKSGAGGSVFRNVLVVAQFTISIALLVGTSVVYNQLQFIRSKDLGFEKENLIYTRLQHSAKGNQASWRTAFQANDLTADVTIASGLPTNHISGTADVTWQGKDPGAQIMFANIFVDENFIPTYNMNVVTGRNFYKDMLGDSSNFIINEKAAEVMGFTPETAIGQGLKLWDNSNGTIVGVVKDFNFKPLQESIEPLLMSANTWGRVVVIKSAPGKTAETIAAMESVWNSVDQLYPFTYNFVDQDLENLYQSDRQVGTLFTGFAVLAIIISCLGLYGLSAYIAEQRIREIGIRKALGASVGHIIYLLNTRFIVPVLIAIVIAAPLAWYAMNQWLDGFAYKVEFKWVTVLIAGGLAIIVSLLTVSFESVKAARMNPTRSLRIE
jgi:ABC-type antimicrobial peptide transport system permease subunit